MKKPSLTYKSLPESDSNRWLKVGISNHFGQKNRSSTVSSLGRRVYSSSSRPLFLLLNTPMTPQSFWRQRCKTQLGLVRHLYTDFIPVSFKEDEGTTTLLFD